MGKKPQGSYQTFKQYENKDLTIQLQLSPLLSHTIGL